MPDDSKSRPPRRPSATDTQRIPPEMLERLRAAANPSEAEQVATCRALHARLRTLQTRDFRADPSLSVSDCELIIDSWSFDPKRASDERKSLLKRMKSVARETARRWKAAGGVITPDPGLARLLPLMSLEERRRRVALEAEHHRRVKDELTALLA